MPINTYYLCNISLYMISKFKSNPDVSELQQYERVLFCCSNVPTIKPLHFRFNCLPQ